MLLQACTKNLGDKRFPNVGTTTFSLHQQISSAIIMSFFNWQHLAYLDCHVSNLYWLKPYQRVLLSATHWPLLLF